MNKLVWAIIGWVLAVANAAECGKIKFLTERSRGVEAKFTPCPDGREVAEGTILSLVPGARLWLKLPASDAGQEYQVVCQSRAKSTLVLLIESLNPPWLGSRSLKCGPWDGSGFACDGVDGQPKLLVCAVGEFSLAAVETLPRKGASIVLRSPEALDGLEEPSRRQQVLEAIEREGQLCHKLYGVGRKLRVEWTVDAQGQVTEVRADELEEGDSELAECIVRVVQSYPYPKPSRTMSLQATL